MSKKKYVSPEMEELILEQSDIITVSVGGTSGSYGDVEDEFGDYNPTNTLNGWQ